MHFHYFCKLLVKLVFKGTNLPTGLSGFSIKLHDMLKAHLVYIHDQDAYGTTLIISFSTWTGTQVSESSYHVLDIAGKGPAQPFSQAQRSGNNDPTCYLEDTVCNVST